MAEYTNVALQTVADEQNVLFAETPVPCTRGNVTHREGSGIFRLRGAQCRARYKVSFGANLSIPTGGTVGDVSIALSLDSEPLGSATAIETLAAIGDFANVFVAAYIDVPCGCCATVAVKNTSDQDIDVQNANLIIERVA